MPFPEVLAQAWGHSKATFYSTDYIDDELGGSSDEGLAEEEEREVLDMQQRIAETLQEGDFGIEPLMMVKVQLISKGINYRQ